MRAALYNGQRNIELAEIETPTAGDNDIVVKNIYASICGTDVAVYEHGPNTGHRVTIGIAAAIALKYFGGDKIMVCDHSDFRLEKARHLGL